MKPFVISHGKDTRKLSLQFSPTHRENLPSSSAGKTNPVLSFPTPTIKVFFSVLLLHSYTIPNFLNPITVHVLFPNSLPRSTCTNVALSSASASVSPSSCLQPYLAELASALEKTLSDHLFLLPDKKFQPSTEKLKEDKNDDVFN